jgi:hypothetical protein
MRLTRISAAPQTVHDKSSISATAYLDTSSQGVVVDFYASAPLPSYGPDAIKVATAATDASGIANVKFVMDKDQLASVIANSGSIGADLPFSMGLAGSAKTISLVAYCPSYDSGVSCALLYDEAGVLPEGGAVAGEGQVSSGGAGQVVISAPQVAGATAPTGSATNHNTMLWGVIALVVVVVAILLWRKYKEV